MKRIVKWAVSAAVVLTAGVCLIIAGMVQFINSSFGRNVLLDRVNTFIAGDLTVSNLRLSLLNGSLDLSEVTLKDRTAMGVAGFDKLYLKADWSYLLKKEIRIEQVRLERPWGRLYLGAGGRLNLLDAVQTVSKAEEAEEKPAASKGLPINVTVQELLIKNGDISFDSPAQALSLQAAGINIKASGDLLAERASLGVLLTDINFKTKTIQLPSTRVALAAELDRSRLALTDLKIQSGKSTLALSGQMTDLFALAGLDLSAHSSINLAELARILQLDGAYEGDVVLDAAAAGEIENPKLSLNVVLENGLLFKRFFDRVELAAHLQDRKVLLEKGLAEIAQGRLGLTGQADLKTAFADGFFKPPVNLDAIAFDVVLDQKAADIGPWVPEVAGLEGALESHLSLSGKGVSLKGLAAEAVLKVNGTGLSAKGVQRPLNGHFNLGAKINGKMFEVGHLDGVIDGIAINGNGGYQLDAQAVAAQLVLDAKNLSQPLTLVGLPKAKGSVNLSLDLKGTLGKPELGLVLQSKDLGYGDVAIGTVNLAAGLTRDRVLEISSLNLINQGSAVKGRAQMRFAEGWKGIDPQYHQSLELNLSSIEVRDFYHQEIVRGEIDGRLALSGMLKALQGTLDLDARDVTTPTVRVGNLSTSIGLEGNLVRLKALHLQNKSSELSANGSILLLDDTFGKMAKDPEFQLTLTSSKLQVQDFVNAFKGTFTLDSALNGTLLHPKGDLSMHGTGLDTGVQRFAALDLSAHVSGDRVNVAPFKVTLKENESLSLSGWAKWDRSFSFELYSGGVTLASVDAMKELKAFSGVLQAYISGYGTLDNPVVDGSLLLGELRINDQPLDDFRLHVGIHDHLLRAFGALNFDVDASYHLLRKEFAARLDFYQTQLNSYLKIAGQPDINGTVTGQVTVNGNAERPNDAVAEVDLQDLALYLDKSPLIRTDRVRARMVDQHIRLEDTKIQLLSNGTLSAAGAARLNGPIEVALDGRLPVADGAIFSELLADAKGEVGVSAKATGSLPQPKVYADVTLADIGLALPQISQKIDALNGRIDIDPDSIDIKSITGKIDTGLFNLAGTIRHDFFTPQKIGLKFSADTLPIELPDALSLVLNSEIEISGEKGSGRAKGDIVLVSGSYYKDVNINLMLLETIGKRSRSAAPAAQPIELPFFKEIDLDIDVSYREPFLVQNNLAELEIRPDLTVGGTLSRPVIKGRADVTDGTIIFKKKSFEVKKGVIDFVNPYKTEMTVDIESVTTIRDNWEIELNLKGPPDKLELRLKSTPEESDADILSLLIFGKTGQELSGGGTQNNVSTRQLLAGILADTLGEELKGATGMDILELETSDETNGSSQQSSASEAVKVTVGKNLSDRMSVKVAMESKDGEMVQKAISEYKFLENILLSVNQDTQGVFGGELVFRIEFR